MSSMQPETTQDKNFYFTNPENVAEMARLTKQAHLVTEAMGGSLAEQTDLAHVHNLLDLACGPGEWVLEVASRYPDKQITGVDISQIMIEYAHLQTLNKQLNNAHFRGMDILKPLSFPDQTFDLVNVRLIASFMFRSLESWPRLMQECKRILRPGGTIRLTDCEWMISNSPITEKLFGLCTRATYLAGNIFSQDGRHIAVTPMLGRFLRDAGYEHIQHRAFAIDGSAGSKNHQSFYEDMVVFLKLVQPLLIQTGTTTEEEAEILYQQSLEEMNAEDFNCIWYYLTAWGKTPLS